MAQHFKSEFTYSSLVRYIQETPRVSSKLAGMEKESESGSQKWTQTKSLQEAIDLATNGWESGIKKLASELELAVSGNMEVQHNIVGSIVDVGAYLSGSPECMIEFIDMVERDKPELTMYVGLTYHGGIDGEDALKYAMKVIETVVMFSKDYDIKLVGAFCSQQGDIYDTQFITIKDTYQNLVLNNLAFAFHPSYFRRIWFRYIETKDYRAYGYGRPADYNMLKTTCLEHCGKTGSKKRVVILPSIQHQGLNWNPKDVKIEDVK